jgi:hypothetical protein
VEESSSRPSRQLTEVESADMPRGSPSIVPIALFSASTNQVSDFVESSSREPMEEAESGLDGKRNSRIRDVLLDPPPVEPVEPPPVN